MGGDAFASFFFLPKSPRWEKEKPYTLKFQPADNFPMTSEQRVEVKDILVKDIRGQESSFSLDENGFAVMPMRDLGMTYEDFSDDNKVKTVYLRAVAKQLQAYLGASRVQVFDLLVPVSFRCNLANLRDGYRFARVMRSFQSLLVKDFRIHNRQTSCI